MTDDTDEKPDKWNVQLGYPPASKPEYGVSAQIYYAKKHARGEYGRYWPLHVTASPRFDNKY
jgi:hypothetical protein